MTGYYWEKQGLFFDPKQHQRPEWMSEFAQAPHVLRLGDIIRVFFSCRPKADANGQYVSYSAYADFDQDLKLLAISEKPFLPLGNPGTFDEFGTYPVSVIRKGEQYLAYYAGWTRCESVPFNTAIGIATSHDGGNFSRVGEGPLISYSAQEPFVISGPKIRYFNNRYYLFYIAGTEWLSDNGRPEPVYKIRMAVSEDGWRFDKKNAFLIPDHYGSEEAQASPDVFYRDGQYHMYFCYRQGRDYRNRANGYRIGYATSTDLMNWERTDEDAGITVSESGWDSEMVSYPHVFEHKGDLHMFYLGNGVGRDGFGHAILKQKQP